MDSLSYPRTLWQAFRLGPTTLPFAPGMPGSETWLRRSAEEPSQRELFWLNVRRFVLLHILGQGRWWRPRIPPLAREILWLHLSDHVGDSLMRLSAAPLLADRALDLCASAKAAQLFRPGGLFRRVEMVEAAAQEMPRRHYGCVIIDAPHTRPLLLKRQLQARTPFVTLHDFFHYCRDDYNLTHFAWYRMAHLLGADISGEELARRARLSIDDTEISDELAKQLALSGGEIALALGGREDYRIYHHWPAVAELLLHSLPERRLLLLGTDNAVNDALTITAACPQRVSNCVNRLSLGQTAHLLRRCALLLCADGGLLHVANAVSCLTVGLFARELPAHRYVATDRYLALCGEVDVSSIVPERVGKAVVQVLAGAIGCCRDGATGT